MGVWRGHDATVLLLLRTGGVFVEVQSQENIMAQSLLKTKSLNIKHVASENVISIPIE